MPPEEQPLSTTGSAVALRFAAGAALGVLVASVPFAAGHPFQLSALEMLAAALVITASGVMGCLWGGRFLEALSRALDSTSV
jgi:ribosome biogenesis protein Tsr3